jgi:hypothetical protein
MLYKQKLIGNLKQYVTKYSLENRDYRQVGYDLFLKVADYRNKHNFRQHVHHVYFYGESKFKWINYADDDNYVLPLEHLFELYTNSIENDWEYLKVIQCTLFKKYGVLFNANIFDAFSKILVNFE